MYTKMDFSMLILSSLIGLSLQAEWSYDDESQWSGVCTTGSRQSPIDIVTEDAVEDVEGSRIMGPLAMSGYGDVSLTAANSGRALTWSLVPGTPAPTLSGGPLNGSYSFVEFHLHWLSEHSVDGVKYPLEIHLVHAKSGLSVSEAVLLPDGLAVIGVFAQISSRGDGIDTLDEIMPQIPYIASSTLGATDSFNIDVTNLISPAPQSFYTYEGSLTTPDCHEAVTWIVMDKPIYISGDQYSKFKQVDIGGPYNHRSLQPVNRPVYRSVSSYSSVRTLDDLLKRVSTTREADKSLCALINIKRRMFGEALQQC